MDNGAVGRRLRIAMLAPPWFPVPPEGYGGIEAVVDLLCDRLARSGHEVTLFAAAGSRSKASVVVTLEHSSAERINFSLYEADHVARSFDWIDAEAHSGRPFDVLHDHSGFTALAFADRIDTPVVHTLHGPLTEETLPFYREHARKATIVAISEAQLEGSHRHVEDARIVPNPIAVDDWPFREEKDDFLLWIGRMDDGKGPHRAIAAAQLARRPLVLAGPVQPGGERFFKTKVVPQLDGDRIRYVGEVGPDAKRELFSRARALLMPIRWPEPFGMVMVEALACGTPVIAFPEGAAREVVIDGENGYLVEDELEMAGAVARLDRIDGHICRATTSKRYEAGKVAQRYVDVYRSAAGASSNRVPRLAATTRRNGASHPSLGHQQASPAR